MSQVAAILTQMVNHVSHMDCNVRQVVGHGRQVVGHVGKAVGHVRKAFGCVTNGHVSLKWTSDLPSKQKGFVRQPSAKLRNLFSLAKTFARDPSPSQFAMYPARRAASQCTSQTPHSDARVSFQSATFHGGLHPLRTLFL